MILIVDTNVAIVANGNSEQASPECVISCKRQLDFIKADGTLLLDDKFLIIGEYLKKLRSSGQPGAGDAFLKWVLQNRATEKCQYQTITPRQDDPTNFEEFPLDDRLSRFDLSDRKFAALALVHHEHPPILNAVDTDWWLYKDVLSEHKVSVIFLCEADIRRLLSE